MNDSNGKAEWTRDEELLAEHRHWFSSFQSHHLRQWENLLGSAPEAAACEAATRRFLEQNGNEVVPNETLAESGRSPDFRCNRGGEWFYVESTCITIQTLVKKLGLPHERPPSGGGSYPLVYPLVFEEARQKVTQLSGLDAPSALLVGTWHEAAGRLLFDEDDLLMLLTGRLGAKFHLDGTGNPGAATPITTLEGSAFVRPINKKERAVIHERKKTCKLARLPISALLVACWSVPQRSVLGFVHPKPNRPLKLEVLPTVEFFGLADGHEDGQFSTMRLSDPVPGSRWRTRLQV